MAHESDGSASGSGFFEPGPPQPVELPIIGVAVELDGDGLSSQFQSEHHVHQGRGGILRGLHIGGRLVADVDLALAQGQPEKTKVTLGVGGGSFALFLLYAFGSRVAFMHSTVAREATTVVEMSGTPATTPETRCLVFSCLGSPKRSAFIAATARGDIPTGSIEYETIFVVGMALFVMTLALNALSIRLVNRYRQVYE